MKKGGKNKSVVYNFVQCTKYRCKTFCHVSLHLIHLHFYSLEMFSYLVTQWRERSVFYFIFASSIKLFKY